MTQTMKVSEIKVGKRHRKDLGDIAGLAAHREGLLQLLLQEARREAVRRDDDAAAEGRAINWGERGRWAWLKEETR